MKSLCVLILALVTLTSASSYFPTPITIPKGNSQLYTDLDDYAPRLPEANAYLQELLTFSVNFAIKDGIKRGKLCPKANWALGEVVSIGYLQDSQSQIYFTFTLVAEGKDDVTVIVEVLDQPWIGKREVRFFAFDTNLIAGGTFPDLQFPISFSLDKVQDSQYTPVQHRLAVQFQG